eukprot:336105-Pleurochrysis_carterae.AAC.1
MPAHCANCTRRVQAAEEDARREAVAENDAIAAAAVAREINTTTTEARLADLSKASALSFSGARACFLFVSFLSLSPISPRPC